MLVPVLVFPISFHINCLKCINVEPDTVLMSGFATLLIVLPSKFILYGTGTGTCLCMLPQHWFRHPYWASLAMEEDERSFEAAYRAAARELRKVVLTWVYLSSRPPH
jgi:hypothetical protein